MKNHRKIVFLIVSIAVMAVIFTHSAMPADLSTAESSPMAEWAARMLHIGIDPATILVRKAAHFTEYLILGLFLALTGNEFRHTGKPVSRMGLMVWVIGTAYAVSDEIHQFFVAGRSCEVRDVCIDSAGVFAGVLIICLLYAKTGKKIR